ncbi:MAG: hypothetical protein KF831_10350 [Acidobacteria bacterium]|nr:hypothetical protein [Acidobacteriota bacterium]
MARKQLTDLDFDNVSKAINLPNPQNPQDAATKDYVDTSVEGLAWKDAVHVATSSNINLTSAPATIDGQGSLTGKRILVKDQSTASENGIYVHNGAGQPMTRALDANTADELNSAIVTVLVGPSGGSSFRQTTVDPIVGSSAINWTTFGTGAPSASESTPGIAEIATQGETDTGTDDSRFITPSKLANWSGRIRKHSATFGDGSATQYDVTHSFGTRDVIAQVRRVASPYDEVNCDIEAVDINTVRLRFSAAPTTNQFRVTILA